MSANQILTANNTITTYHNEIVTGCSGTPVNCLSGACPLIYVCNFNWNLLPVSSSDITPDTGMVRQCNDQWWGEWVATGDGCTWIISNAGETNGFAMVGLLLDPVATQLSYNNTTHVFSVVIFAATSGKLIWSGQTAAFGFTLNKNGGFSSTASITIKCRDPVAANCTACTTPRTVTLGGATLTIVGIDCSAYLNDRRIHRPANQRGSLSIFGQPRYRRILPFPVPRECWPGLPWQVTLQPIVGQQLRLRL